jgi:hypothetical protein
MFHESRAKLDSNSSFIEIKVDSIYTISNGHTHTVDGYLRLYANQFEPSNSQISQANIENNCSLVRLERKLL